MHSRLLLMPQTYPDRHEQLTPEQYRILREKGTERPGSSPWNSSFEDGIYHCIGCGNALFHSHSKFDAHCGWPSFDQIITTGSVLEKPDNSHGMLRTEVLCGQCEGHLGHVFEDGPTETHRRFCINGAILTFEALP